MNRVQKKAKKKKKKNVELQARKEGKIIKIGSRDKIEMIRND